MNNIKIFENDLPSDIDLSNEKVIGLDCEALGLVAVSYTHLPLPTKA